MANHGKRPKPTPETRTQGNQGKGIQNDPTGKIKEGAQRAANSGPPKENRKQ